jgi:hypothetical protein
LATWWSSHGVEVGWTVGWASSQGVEVGDFSSSHGVLVLVGLLVVLHGVSLGVGGGGGC